MQELESNLAALALEIAPELLGRLDATDEDPVSYWQTHAALPWN